MKDLVSSLTEILSIIEKNRILTVITVIGGILAIYKLGEVCGSSFYNIFLK